MGSQNFEQMINVYHGIYIYCGIAAIAFLVLAATDDPAVNEAVFREAKARGVPVNTADCKDRCDFYFPGLVVTDDLVVGVTASGGDHGLVRETTEQLKQFLEGGGTHGNAQ